MDNERIGIFSCSSAGQVVLFIIAQIFCLMVMMGGGNIGATTAATTPTTPSIADLTPAQMAVSTSVPFVVAFIFLVVANAKISPARISQLGLIGSHFLPGVLMGLVGSAIAVPLTF